MLADYMRANDGFDGVKVRWKVAMDGLNSTFSYETDSGKGLKFAADGVTIDFANSFAVNSSSMDQFLDQGALIVAQVVNPTTGHNHWVVVTDKQGSSYRIADPGCYGRRNLGEYGDIYRFIVYSKLPIS
jgi:hypothetical protein